MKMQNFAYALFSLIFLFSCSDENLPNGELNEEFLPKMQNANNRINVEEAMNLAEEAIALLDKKHPSESGSKRVVNSTSALLFGNIKSSMLKSGKIGEIGISDTLGYVIVSNDRRVGGPLFAFTKKGSLVNGKTDNPGLKVFLSRLEGYVLESIIKSGKTDGQKLGSAAKAVSLSSFYPPDDTVEVGPLVPVEWGQKYPFWLNLSAPQCSNGYYVTGCVATATAHIMSYWEHPDTLDGVNYNWNIFI